MKKLVICDDDILFAENLKRDILDLLPEVVKTIDIFVPDGESDFFDAVDMTEPAIVLMDIRLGEKNGINLAEEIKTAQPDAQIIFISGYDDYYLDVYEVEHIYFLRKPIERDKLEQAIRRAATRLAEIRKQHFLLSGKGETVKIPLARILYFEKEKRKIHIRTDSGAYSIYGRFPDIEEQLDGRFQRCHNSYIVNIEQVQRMADKKFFFIGERVVPISRTYYQEAKRVFLRYVGQNMD